MMDRPVKTPEQKAADDYEIRRRLTGSDDCMRDAFIAGAKWAAESGYDRNKIVVWGTDACKECDTGRMTLFAEKHGLCIECYHIKQDGLKVYKP